MPKLGIRSGDQIVVITGKGKGQKGKVLKTDLKAKKVIVQGVNQSKKHVRPTRQSPQGGIVDIDVPLDVSNVMLLCPKCGNQVRIGRRLAGEDLVRVCVKCDKEID